MIMAGWLAGWVLSRYVDRSTNRAERAPVDVLCADYKMYVDLRGKVGRS